MKKIIYKNKIIAEIYINLDYGDYKSKPKKSKKGFIKHLTKKIVFTPIGYAGFKEKNALEKSLLSQVFAFDSKIDLNNLSSIKFSQRKVLACIERTIKKVGKVLSPENLIRIFLFPTFQPFVQEKMFGVNGFTSYQNTIHIYLHPEPQNQNVFLCQVNYIVAHEYNHALRFQYFPPDLFNTIADTLVNEGLAENFRIAILGGKISPWADALKRNEVKKVFEKIRPLLISKSSKVYRKIFFGNKKFPLWAGYTVGFQIVKSFLQKNPKLRWNKIIKMNSKQILQKSGWL